MQDAAVRMIADERAALLGFLGRVEGEAWSAPTACPGWSVKDVLAHLVEGELTVGRIYRGELRESGYIDPHTGVAKWSALPGVAVRAAFWQHGSATQRVLDALTPEAWRSPIHALGCREIRQLVRLHLFDLAVHGHDLTDALAAPPVWTDRLPFLVEFVVRAAPATMRRRGITPDGAVEVRAGDRRWLVSGGEDGWRIEPDPGPGSIVAVFEPADLVLAVTGRLDLDEALARADVDGDAGAVRGLLEGWQVLATS